MDEAAKILQAVEEQQVRFVALWFTDITGLVKSVMIPASELENVFANGSHFDGSAIEGFARVAESDMVLVPDVSSYVLLPWTDKEDKTARLICSICTQHGDPFIGDPRSLLIKALDAAKALNLRFKTGMELEFFLFPLDQSGQPLVSAQNDIAGYFDIPDDPIRSMRRRMLTALNAMGIRVDSTHSETGSGQHEIDFQYDDALRSADNILTARIALKTIAGKYNYFAVSCPAPMSISPGRACTRTRACTMPIAGSMSLPTAMPNTVYQKRRSTFWPASWSTPGRCARCWRPCQLLQAPGHQLRSARQSMSPGLMSTAAL